MKKILKSKIFIVIITMIICISGTLYAANVYYANTIKYTPSDSSWNVTNVSDALNSLYSSRNNISCSDNVSSPEIKGDLIPVTISNDGTVKYADTNSKWYNYCNKEWANAVILSSGTYKVGDIIPDSSIESYFVWIPRFRYKLWNTGTAIKKAHSIEIEFETKDVSASTGSNNGEWLTHPAFTTFNSNGFWVGKFETGYNGATSTATAQVNSNDSSKVIIKPNVYSWRNITVGNIFLTSYNYKRELDSHMMKNTEWGAVAYLSHSKYGIGVEVNINNNSSYKTGYSALPSTNQNIYQGKTGDGDKYNKPYNTEIGYLASTTGNITGIYDMSGGAWEYVAGYVSGKPGSSGLTPTDYDSKYFDVYNASSTQTSYQYRILGDATGEMGPIQNYDSAYHNSWYADHSNFIDSSSLWFRRGGGFGNGVSAGQFCFGRYAGGAYGLIGFRLVLTP